MGYTYEAEKVFHYRGAAVTVSYKVHNPPDIRACMFRPRNRRRRQWLETAQPQEEEGSEWMSDLEAAAERARHADAE